VEFQFCMAVAAVLETERFVLVVARREGCRCQLQVSPDVARRVLRAVDADEGAEPVVGVKPEHRFIEKVLVETSNGRLLE